MHSSRPVTGLLIALVALPAGADVALPFEFDFTSREVYDGTRGFGYERDAPAKFSVRLPEGTYRVTLTPKGRRHATSLRVLSEQRRVMVDRTIVDNVDSERFLVDVRIPALPGLPANATGGTQVALKPREIGAANWDEKLTLEFAGNATFERLRIEAATAPTLFLAGDSTVTDQPVAPNGSWGQALPRFFADSLAVANHAESGETLKSFVTELRLAKLLSRLRAGDWVMIQFGHNDQKVQWPQTHADAATTYRAWLRTYIAEIRARGATPILVTSPDRRNFDANGRIDSTLGDYPEAMRIVGREEGIAVIDLNAMSRRFYEALGPEAAARVFADGGRDKTHFNDIGALALARCVVEGVRAADPQLVRGLAQHLAANAGRFDPAHPEIP
jgi:lysophospholipase L1-like esterase